MTWDELPSLLEKVTDRHHIVFEIAANLNDDMILDPDGYISYSPEFDSIDSSSLQKA